MVHSNVEYGMLEWDSLRFGACYLTSVTERLAMSGQSDFLFAQPSFLEGAARILDFDDTLTDYNTSIDPDVIAIRMDWRAVYHDFRMAVTDFGRTAKERAAKEQLTAASRR